MKTVFLGEKSDKIFAAYSDAVKQRIRTFAELPDFVVAKSELNKYAEYLSECEYAFATWGMLKLSEEEIKKYLPKLKAVFYAAGTVQYFAKPYLRCGVRVFSAWRANAVPVAEFTVAQIVLANKGYFTASARCKKNQLSAYMHTLKHCGNYESIVGVVGCGVIGSMVCERLQGYNCKVLVYDKFIADERIAQLGAIRAVSLEQIFSECDVITNHLADKDELCNIFNYELFRLMKPYSTFINTGRGRQVDDAGLAKALREDKTRTALIDVVRGDVVNPLNPLIRCKNAFVTPHIAGSLSNEIHRMGELMAAEAESFDCGRTSENEVTLKMLETMA